MLMSRIVGRETSDYFPVKRQAKTKGSELAGALCFLAELGGRFGVLRGITKLAR